MKKFFGTILFVCTVTLALVFVQCDGIGITGEELVPVEDIIIERLNSGYVGFTLLDTSPANPQSLEGIGRATVILNIRMVPENAVWGVSWESDNPAIFYDTARFEIVGTAPVELATVTFISLGKKADGTHATKEVFVSSNVMDEARVLRWNFSSIPSDAAGWVSGTNAVGHTVDANVPDRNGKGYFITLLRTPNIAIDAVNKRIRTAGGTHNDFAHIENIQGPFRILIPFEPGGSGGNRFPTVRVGSGPVYNQGGGVVNSEGTSTRRTLDYSYTGTDTNTIILGQQGGLYVYEIILELQH